MKKKKQAKPQKRKQPTPPADGTRLIGYARVSTEDQNVEMQLDALRDAGVLDDNLYYESVSGVAKKRPQLAMALSDAREGDTFVVWKLDRLGRTARQLHNQLHDFDQRGIKFRSITELIDTSTFMGQAMFGLMAVFAQLERGMIAARTKTGMKALADRGGPKPGAQAKMPPKGDAKLEKLLGTRLVREVAAKYDCLPQTVYARYNSAELELLRKKRAKRKH